MRGWGSLIETGGLFERGVISLRKYDGTSSLEYKVKKLKYEKLKAMHPRITNKFELPVGK